MEVERAKSRHAPYLFRKHPECHHHKKIRLQGLELGYEFRILQFDRLQNRYPFLQSELLHGALVNLLSTSARLVGDGHHSGDDILIVQECLQGSHGELRSAHIHDPCLPEQPDHLALGLSPPVLQGIHIGHVLVVYCLECQVYTY